eukprot:6150183-Alexandrium_andersonii.AAC.1
MVLLQGPPETRGPMERRLRRDPLIHTACGEFRLLEVSCVRPAARGLIRPGRQAEALAGATR